MAKKDFPSGIVILGLLIIGLIHEHWRVLLPILGVVLALWAISKFVGKQPSSKSKPQRTVPASASSTSTATLRSKAVSPDAAWIPQGKAFKHAGFTIQGGFVYFGKGLEAIRGWSIEPSLIDPSLPVKSLSRITAADTWIIGRHIPKFTRHHGAAFLDWLSGGRKDRSANIGYVFIYFYGSRSASSQIPKILLQHAMKLRPLSLK